MGAEQSAEEASTAPPPRKEAGWAMTQCTALGLVEEGRGALNLLSCACTALGEVENEVDDVTFPVEHEEAVHRRRSLRSGQRIDEFTTTTTVDEPRPVTFEEATGAGRILDAARRSRAQEVRESEANFMKEFSNLMATGITVHLEVPPTGTTLPVHLLLAPGGAIEWHSRGDNDTPRSGRLALDEISSVQTNPDPASLGFDLAARSFRVVDQSGDAKLFHADSKDICSLLVDGLVMMVKRGRRLKKRKGRLRGNSVKPLPPPTFEKHDDSHQASPSSSSSSPVVVLPGGGGGSQLKDIQNTLLEA